jgi:hypothetical protein
MRRANSSRRAVSWPGRSSSFLHFRIQPPCGLRQGDRVSCVNLAPNPGIVESLLGVLSARPCATICVIGGCAYTPPFASPHAHLLESPMLTMRIAVGGVVALYAVATASWLLGLLVIELFNL